MSTAIEATHLSFAFEQGNNVLTDVSFRIEEGERVGILGGNGAGKSTLVWCLAGLLRPQGELRIFGEKPSPARGRVGLVFQNPEDQLFMPSIEEDIMLPLVNRGINEQEAAAESQQILRTVDLLECAGRPASKLSYGQRKRAAIASVLVTRPEILILDEPTAELDGRAVGELKTLLAGLTCTLVLVTHDVTFAQSLTRKIILLAKGKIAANGPTEAICNSHKLLEDARIC